MGHRTRQVFSLAFGSVADDLNAGNIKGSRTRNHAPSLLKVNETGVTFRSYRDGRPVTLTPESTVQHQVRPRFHMRLPAFCRSYVGAVGLNGTRRAWTKQKKLGADIIIPLDELPPYRITKQVSPAWLATVFSAPTGRALCLLQAATGHGHGPTLLSLGLNA